ncbi:uncharacterized protein LOC62_01G001760 [Vanrija pseudolonga]|uniref:Uncharacterized protein n=1 Tax=Vanrija pseudolonga TaxID=143232 RepID=A0AAF1BNK2_9TREE|nr:hypothetical protein LOC62_01G001760 [Vanrija pseudolonga]
MLPWGLVSTALLGTTAFAQPTEGFNDHGWRGRPGPAPSHPAKATHSSRLNERYQIGGFTLQDWTSPDGQVWTVKHPDETLLPLLKTPPDGTSPREPDIFWVAGKVGRFTTRMPPLPGNSTLTRVFDATPILSHPDKSVLAEDRDIRQWTVDSRNWTISNRPYRLVIISEEYPEGFFVQVP